MIWQQWSEGHITDDDAEAFSGAVGSRKAFIRAKAAQPSERHRTTLQRRPTRDRGKILRRRRLAASGVLPGRIAIHFSQAEAGVLTVIGREVRRQKSHCCELSVARIASLAATCRTTTQGTLRLARHLGIISVRERPRAGQKSLTNIVKIASGTWKTWLRLSNRAPKLKHPIITSSYRADDSAKNGCNQPQLSYTFGARPSDSAKSAESTLQGGDRSTNFE